MKTVNQGDTHVEQVMRAVVSTGEPSKNPRLDGLQALRALAAASVILTHLHWHYNNYFIDRSPFDAFTRGTIGVQLFFVISGFIIVYVHWDDIGRATQIRSYAVKRIARIVPLCWLMISINFLYDIFLQSRGSGVLSAVTHPAPFSYWDYILNLLFVSPNKILGPTWTLTYEMFFYVWFGLGVWLGRRWIMTTGPVWILAILFARYKHFAPENYFLSILLDPRTGMFLLGVMIAWVIKRTQANLVGWPISLAGLVLFSLMWTLPPDATGSWKYSVCEIGGFGLMVFGAALPWGFALPKWVRYLGDASYSTYLVHTAIIMFVFYVVTLFAGVHTIDLPLWGFLGLWLVVLGLTLPIYQFIERPITQWTRSLLSKFAPRSNAAR